MTLVIDRFLWYDCDSNVTVEERETVSTDVYSSRFQGWLKNNQLNADPFSLYEAERELGITAEGAPILSELFVTRPYLYHVLGNPSELKSVFLLARRGCGKTATREMIAYEGLHGRLRRQVLVIRYVEFQPLLDPVQRDLVRLTVRDHVRAILRAGLEAIADQLLSHAIVRLSEAERQLLVVYARTFASPLVRWQIEAQAQQEAAPLDLACIYDHELLDTFAQLVARMGREAVYVLIDGVDECRETAHDPSAAAALLRPLVAEKWVLERPRFGFKLFLPLEVGNLLRPDVRTDVVEWHKIEWDREALAEMVAMRLRYYSDDRVQRLEDLCASDIRYAAMDDLIQSCRGSPRNLLRLCHTLLHMHVEHSTSMLITKSDLRATQLAFEHELEMERRQSAAETALSVAEASAAAPPQEGVYIDRQEHVWVDGVELGDQPSRLEFRLLEALYRRKGEIVPSEVLVQTVWGSTPDGQDETNLRKLLSRLRRRLERASTDRDAQFVHNVRGRGYYLKG
jgi:hypothetical protein